MYYCRKAAGWCIIVTIRYRHEVCHPFSSSSLPITWTIVNGERVNLASSQIQSGIEVLGEGCVMFVAVDDQSSEFDAQNCLFPSGRKVLRSSLRKRRASNFIEIQDQLANSIMPSSSTNSHLPLSLIPVIRKEIVKPLLPHLSLRSTISITHRPDGSLLAHFIIMVLLFGALLKTQSLQSLLKNRSSLFSHNLHSTEYQCSLNTSTGSFIQERSPFGDSYFQEDLRAFISSIGSSWKFSSDLPQVYT